MSADVETMAYTNEVPWHGLGFKVDGNQSVAQMLKAAKLDWNVNREPLFLKGVKDPIEGFAALVRDKDRAMFDVVGSQYTPVQNAQAFEVFNEAVKAGKASMETAGALKGGRIVWGLAALKSSFTLTGGDKVNGYLLCVCPHEQGKSNIFKLTAVRVVCRNTLALALRSGGSEVRRSHRGEFTEASVADVKDALGIARDQFGELEKTAIKLVKKKVTQETVIRTLLPIFSADTTYEEAMKKPTPKLARILDIYEKAPGAQVGTAWGVLNAVTYYADHIASRTSDKRLQSAWLGKTANQKEAVLEALLEL